MRRTAARATLGLALAAAVLGTIPLARPAAADPAGPTGSADLAAARAQARALQAAVDQLRDRQELAVEEYVEATTALSAAADTEFAGAQQVDALTATVAAARSRTARTARQLYMAGGAPALYATVLGGDSLADVASRAAAVRSVVAGTGGDIGAAQDALAAAQQLQQQRSMSTEQQAAYAEQAHDAADRAAVLAGQVDALLRSATADMLRLMAAEQAEAQAAASLPTAGPVAAPADEVAAMDRSIAEAAAAPATPYAAAALTEAKRWLGTPYSAGGGGVNGPSTGWCSSSAPDDGRTDSGACAADTTVGFDCSSFMLRVFSVAGYSLPRVSRQQYWAGQRIPLAQIAPGDLLFWAYDRSNPATIHHVALYLGHGLMVHSPHTGDRVRVAAVYTSGLIGAMRPGRAA